MAYLYGNNSGSLGNAGSGEPIPANCNYRTSVLSNWNDLEQLGEGQTPADLGYRPVISPCEFVVWYYEVEETWGNAVPMFPPYMTKQKQKTLIITKTRRLWVQRTEQLPRPYSAGWYSQDKEFATAYVWSKDTDYDKLSKGSVNSISAIYSRLCLDESTDNWYLAGDCPECEPRQYPFDMRYMLTDHNVTSLNAYSEWLMRRICNKSRYVHGTNYGYSNKFLNNGNLSQAEWDQASMQNELPDNLDYSVFDEPCDPNVEEKPEVELPYCGYLREAMESQSYYYPNAPESAIKISNAPYKILQPNGEYKPIFDDAVLITFNERNQWLGVNKYNYLPTRFHVDEYGRLDAHGYGSSDSGLPKWLGEFIYFPVGDTIVENVEQVRTDYSFPQSMPYITQTTRYNKLADIEQAGLTLSKLYLPNSLNGKPLINMVDRTMPLHEVESSSDLPAYAYGMLTGDWYVDNTGRKWFKLGDKYYPACSDVLPSADGILTFDIPYCGYTEEALQIQPYWRDVPNGEKVKINTPGAEYHPDSYLHDYGGEKWLAIHATYYHEGAYYPEWRSMHPSEYVYFPLPETTVHDIDIIESEMRDPISSNMSELGAKIRTDDYYQYAELENRGVVFEPFFIKNSRQQLKGITDESGDWLTDQFNNVWFNYRNSGELYHPCGEPYLPEVEPDDYSPCLRAYEHERLHGRVISIGVQDTMGYGLIEVFQADDGTLWALGSTLFGHNEVTYCPVNLPEDLGCFTEQELISNGYGSIAKVVTENYDYEYEPNPVTVVQTTDGNYWYLNSDGEYCPIDFDEKRICDCTINEIDVIFYLNPYPILDTDIAVEIPVTKEVCEPIKKNRYEWECDETELDEVMNEDIVERYNDYTYLDDEATNNQTKPDDEYGLPLGLG